MTNQTRSLILTFCLAIFTPTLVQAATVMLGRNTESRSLGLDLEYLEDPGGALTIDQVLAAPAHSRFVPSQSPIPNFGFSRSAYWFRTTVQNSDTARHQWLLEVRYPLLDQIEVYQLSSSGKTFVHRAGDLLPFGQRALRQRSFAFPIEIPAGESCRFYIRLATESSLHADLVLWSPRAFLEYKNNEQFAFGIYYGILAAMLLYNLLLYFSVHDRLYLYYVGYLLSYGLFQFSINGLAYEYLWPNLPWWGGRATPFFQTLALLLAIQFSRALLELHRHMPRTDRLFVGLMFFAASLVAGTFFLGYHLIIKLSTFTALVTTIYLAVVGWLCWRRHSKLAAYYVLAWTVFLLGASTRALKAFAVLPEMFITEYAMQIGSALEVLLLSFVLAHRIRLLKEENEKIQRDAAETMEQRVTERTMDLQDALAKLADANLKLEELNDLDGLTGIKNRRYFHRQLDNQWHNAVRARSPVGLLLVDIDHFKRINDTFGHLCGDQVLKSVARCIKKCLPRATDDVARYGGEEFVIILPHTDGAGALVVAERIRSRVSAIATICELGEVRTQVSIGVASMVPTRQDDPLNLIAYADQALYRAKEGGRNRVTIYPVDQAVRHITPETAQILTRH